MRKKLSLIAVASVLALFATGCGADGNGSEESKAIKLPKSGATPVLSLSNAEGSPGETVEITLSVKGADNKWCSSGVHIIYDENLVCVPSEADPETPSYKKGPAVEEMMACIAKLWTDKLLPELEKDNKHSVFFCSAGDGDCGKDGDIATFEFVIPADAQSGKVYDIEFFYREGDMFANSASEQDFQDYAFSNWQNGSIKVK
ncbi:MAG: hypothetical protein E7500_01420 [Ruminococcus sp.]|nr:hypothetical protein [Ruminococcus sp.]